MTSGIKNPMDDMARNKFVDKVMSFLPDDPLTQTKFIYYLYILIICGLSGYAIVSWYTTFTLFNLKTLFSSVFMTAIALMTILGFKQTRNNYLMMKEMYKQKQNQEPLPSVEDMMKVFKDEKK